MCQELAIEGAENHYQVRVFDFLKYLDVLQLDVEKLVHALDRSSNGNSILKLNCDFLAHQGFEKAAG